MQWRKWPEISERHEQNRPAFIERFVFRNDPFSPSHPHLIIGHDCNINKIRIRNNVQHQYIPNPIVHIMRII